MPSSKKTLGTGKVAGYEFEVTRREWWKNEPHNPRVEVTVRIFSRFTWNGEERKNYELPTGINGRSVINAIMDEVDDIAAGRKRVAPEAPSPSFADDDIAF